MLPRNGFDLEEPVTHAVDRPRWIRAALLAGFGLMLVWQIITRSFAAYLAAEAPTAALSLRPSEPTALVTLADNELNPPSEETKASVAQEVLDGKQQHSAEDADKIAGWAEIALKAAAAKLPLDPGREEASSAGGGRAPLTDADKALIRRRAEMVLAQEPLNARALRILGQLADAQGDEVRAAKLMRAAADHSLAESVAVYWMLEKSLGAKDYAQTLSYADILLRKRPQLMVHVVPALGQMAESADKNAVTALEAALTQNPPWRRSFFGNLPRGISDARTPLNLLLSLKDGPAPPTTAELGAYLKFLISRKLYELAYYTWLQFLPADQLGRIGYLDNAGFESEPSGLPFDWVIAQGAGATIDIAALPDTADAHALLLDLGPGRANFRGVTQLLMLTPGSYRLKGKLKGESRGKRGLQWSVTCAGSRQPPIGESPMFVGVSITWSEFDFTFTVPHAGCRAQELRLALAARSASEQLVSGSVWYDDLQITRLPEADAAESP